MEEAGICGPDEYGLVFPLLESEATWTPWIRAVLYTMALVYIFLGVNIVADKFMSSIEAITAKKLRVKVKTTGRIVTVKKWNDTVANLTLMALGSSAPEILLSIMEIIMSGFHAGELGPSTIVGSAAFNLFVIIAVCMVSIPDGEKRAIAEYTVFIITAIFSLFAYFWLVFIVQLSSPDVIEIWEGSVTLALFPVLVVISYGADVGWFTSSGTRNASSKLQADLPVAERQALESQMQAQMQRAQPASARQGQLAVKSHAETQSKGKVINDLDGQPIVNKHGVLTFEADTMDVLGGREEARAKVVVYRHNGCTGTVACKYRMEKLTAIPGRDYVEEEGSVTMGPGISSAEIDITILPKKAWEVCDSFQIILEDASGGAVFNPNDDGGEDCCLLTITIINGDARRAHGSSAKMLNFVDGVFNVDNITYASGTWKEDIIDSIFNAGGDEDEPASDFDKVMHVISLPWKFLFAVLIPPAAYAGGWICFCLSLAFIGGLTAIIIDFAELFGCVTQLQDSITAITFVALGTSMPDLFASMTAAAQDANADASIVNVTGSNSVNVFLGIGIPWTLAAVYWKVTGANGDWLKHYGSKFGNMYPNGAFIVEGGDLAFSVIVFTFAALIALGVIRMRKGAELGGDHTHKVLSATLFGLLWVFYIALSIWKVNSPAADAGKQVVAIVIGLVVLENVLLAIGGVLKIWQMTYPQKHEALQEAAKSDASSEGTQTVDDDELLEIITGRGAEELQANFRSAALAMLAIAKLKRRRDRKGALLQESLPSSQAAGTYGYMKLAKEPISEQLSRPKTVGRAAEAHNSAASASWQRPPPLPAPADTPGASAVHSVAQSEAASALPVVVGRPVSMSPSPRTLSFTAAGMVCTFIARLRRRRARTIARRGAAACTQGAALERSDSFISLADISLPDINDGTASAATAASNAAQAAAQTAAHAAAQPPRPPTHTFQAPNGPPVARAPPAPPPPASTTQSAPSVSSAGSSQSSQSGTIMRPPQGGIHAIAAVSRSFMKFFSSHLVDWLAVGAVGYMAGQLADPNTTASAGF